MSNQSLAIDYEYTVNNCVLTGGTDNRMHPLYTEQLGHYKFEQWFTSRGVNTSQYFSGHRK